MKHRMKIGLLLLVSVNAYAGTLLLPQHRSYYTKSKSANHANAISASDTASSATQDSALVTVGSSTQASAGSDQVGSSNSDQINLAIVVTDDELGVANQKLSDIQQRPLEYRKQQNAKLIPPLHANYTVLNLQRANYAAKMKDMVVKFYTVDELSAYNSLRALESTRSTNLEACKTVSGAIRGKINTNLRDPNSTSTSSLIKSAREKAKSCRWDVESSTDSLFAKSIREKLPNDASVVSRMDNASQMLYVNMEKIKIDYQNKSIEASRQVTSAFLQIANDIKQQFDNNSAYQAELAAAKAQVDLYLAKLGGLCGGVGLETCVSRAITSAPHDVLVCMSQKTCTVSDDGLVNN